MHVGDPCHARGFTSRFLSSMYLQTKNRGRLKLHLLEIRLLSVVCPELHFHLRFGCCTAAGDCLTLLSAKKIEATCHLLCSLRCFCRQKGRNQRRASRCTRIHYAKVHRISTIIHGRYTLEYIFPLQLDRQLITRRFLRVAVALTSMKFFTRSARRTLKSRNTFQRKRWCSRSCGFHSPR